MLDLIGRWFDLILTSRTQVLIGRWFDLILTSRTQVMIEILHDGQQGCVLFPRLRKNKLLPLFYVLNWVLK